MFIFNFLKGCFGGEDNDIEYLPLARTAMPKPMPMNVTSYLPISARPIPEVDVSASSSTAIAMFEHEAIASMGSPHNSFTSNDTFEDVDLSTPVKFATPPKVLKIVTCPFNDQHEINNILVVSGPLHNGVKVSHMSSTCSSTPPTDYKQPARVAPPFDDEHEVESEPEVEYAPTTPSPGSDYAERALEYQRVSLLFGHDSVEYNNLQRDNTLAVLEGTKPHSTEPLDPELMDTIAIMMGHRREY